ncbi:hypothetical protein P0G78_004126 [Vibrio parahaemolyticus]|nr:hypothetical protein [Vibrio parahaemolyticus]
MKQLVFMLDSDEEPREEFKERHEDFGSYKIETFSKLSEINERLRSPSSEIPAAILVDLYSNNPSSHKTSVELKQLEDDLKEFGRLRRVLEKGCSEAWTLSGKKRAALLLKELKKLDLDQVVPVAIASRYGRRLMAGPDVHDLNENGIYWCWKNRDMPLSLQTKEEQPSELELQKIQSDSAKIETDCGFVA